jgi:hypothetical protein
MNADGSGQTRITNNPAADLQPDWSPDGTKLAFYSQRDGVAGGEIYTTNADGTNPVRLTNNSAVDSFPAWSPSGTQIAFQSNRSGSFDIYKMNADGTGQTDLTNSGPSSDNQRPNWSPHGTIYFDGDIGSYYTILEMDANGNFLGQAFNNTSFSTPAYAASPSPGPPGNPAFVYRGVIWRCDYSSGPCDAGTCAFPGPYPGCSFVAFGGYPDWQPIAYPGYARPKGASPFRASLVPAYKSCDPNTANSSHRGSINSQSCVPPTPESKYLTVGSPDFNGVGANSIGSVLFKVRTTTPEDISIAVNDTDVRCAGTSGGCAGGALSDYAADLRFDTTFRITDKGNFAANPGTVADLPVRFSVPCATTVSTTVGSTCSINTTIDTLLGSSAIVASQRATWQLVGDVKLYDGGADGVASTSADNTLFAVGGLFAP